MAVFGEHDYRVFGEQRDNGGTSSKAKEDRECFPGLASNKFISIERQACHCKSTVAAIENEIGRKHETENNLDPMKTNSPLNTAIITLISLPTLPINNEDYQRD